MKFDMSRSLHVTYISKRYGSQRMISQNNSSKPFKSLPGLSPLPVLGPLHHFLPVIGSIGPPKNFFDLADRLYKKFGPMVRMDVGILSRADMLVLYEPEHFDQVYRSEDIAPLRPGFDTLIYYREKLRVDRFNGVYGLTTAQGQEWREFRTKVNPALLKPKLVKLYEPLLKEIADEMVARFGKMKDDENYLKYNIDIELMKWSLESIALAGLGTRIGCLRDDMSDDHPARKLMKCVKDMLELSFKLEFLPSLWRYISTPNFKKLMKAIDTQWEISEMYIEQAKKTINNRGHDVPEEDKSILEKLLAIDERVAIMMANEMMMAGIETVSFTMTGLLYHLATNPHVQDKLRAEIRSDESKKRYLRACLKESLRIWPVVPANLRRTSKDHIVAGYHIPKGVDFIAPNEYLSRQQKYYPRPTEFLPERWLVEKHDPLYYGNAHPMVTLPFGFGVRSCIGRRLAELEIEVFATKLLDKFQIRWNGPSIEVYTKVVNNFKKPYYFKFEQIG